ncbi:MAG: type II toxin-antitoxin system VapC family toxin [Methylococcales bacterium]|nr:type II toxin-antitoxin system VapC family toxin [Methylococcales bacterium]
MKYLLDTCAISEFTKPEADTGVIEWFNNVNSDDLYLSVINIGEIKKGINKLPASKKKQDLLFWLETLFEDYHNRILTVDLAVMENWSLIVANVEKKGQSVASMDSIIAAVAYTHHLTLVTRNERDFYACNIPMINPWIL